MEFKQLDVRDADLRVALLPHLRDRVFHVTPQANFERIQRSKAILNNRDGRLPLNVASENSFGRMKGWVCLFDLRNRDDRTLEDTLDKYYFLRPPWFVHYQLDFTISELAYLFLDSRTHNDIVSNELAKKECPYGHYIPKTEAWYPGDIPLSRVGSVLLVTIRTAAPKHWFAYAFHQINYERQQEKAGGL